MGRGISDLIICKLWISRSLTHGRMQPDCKCRATITHDMSNPRREPITDVIMLAHFYKMAGSVMVSVVNQHHAVVGCAHADS
eukprot:scaffold542595_cov37-Prasinocladus_malaysianus.AAC.1